MEPLQDTNSQASDLFSKIESMDSEAPEKVFATLAEELEKKKQYKDLFELLLMKKRHELQLPLIQVGSATDIPDELVEPYEEAISDACKKVGELFLKRGDLGQAWPYLRAIGSDDQMKEALEKIEPGTRRKDIDTLVEMAIGEGVHPSRGLEFVVHQYGICSSITQFEQVRPSLKPQDQRACIGILVEALYSDLLENVRSEVGAIEKTDPPQLGLLEIIESRPNLFGEEAYFIDSSHLHSIVRFSPDLEPGKSLDLAIELAEYGSRLAPIYQYEAEAPFDDYYKDHAILLRGIRAVSTGNESELIPAQKHFEAKAETALQEKNHDYPAPVLAQILTSLDSFPLAIDLTREFEQNAHLHGQLGPSLPELCQQAGDFKQLQEIGRDQNDPISFVAGFIQAQSKNG